MFTAEGAFSSLHHIRLTVWARVNNFIQLLVSVSHRYQYRYWQQKNQRYQTLHQIFVDRFHTSSDPFATESAPVVAHNCSTHLMKISATALRRRPFLSKLDPCSIVYLNFKFSVFSFTRNMFPAASHSNDVIWWFSLEVGKCESYSILSALAQR